MASITRRWRSSRPRRRDFGCKCCRLTVLALLLAGTARAQDLPAEQPESKQSTPISIVNIEAGFSDGAANLVRPDYWMPITVQIRNSTGSLFPGKLQVLSRDRDGETVIHELAGFAIKSGMVEDKLFSFFARNPGIYTATTELTVRLLDDKDRLVASQTVPLEYIKESDQLVLDISPQSIKTAIQQALPHDAQRLRGQVRATYLPPDRLPQFWHELEAADVIVCDQPDDLGLGESSDTVKVLTQWVRQGGLLVLGPGTLQSLGDSDLGRNLPAKPLASRRLPPGEIKLSGLNTSLTLKQPRQIGAWDLQPKPDATVLLRLPAEQGGKPVLVRRRLGMGSVVQSGVSIRTLLDSTSTEGLAAGMGTRIKPEIFGIRTFIPQDAQASSSSWGLSWPRDQAPTDLLVGQADFRASGTILATLLMLLIVAYGLAATLGSWVVLKRRNLTQHSWLVFAGLAIIGSVGAAMLVQSARGIRADVKQQSFIDVDGATGLAHIRTFYGLKMPYDAGVDISLATVGHDDLPPDQLRDAYIRPASDLERASGNSFAVKRDYTIRYGDTQIKDVPVRATAKQFESYWCGPVRGVFRASLTPLPAGGLTGGSSITNETDLDLYDCYLVYCRTNSFNLNSRDASIDVVRIDRLPAGKTRNDLADLFDPQNLKSYRLDEVSGSWLSNATIEMGGRRRSFPEHEQQVDRIDSSKRVLAAAMLGLISDLPTPTKTSVFLPGDTKIHPYVDLPREGGRWLDLRNVLDGRNALLVGMVRTPGPMRLKVNGKPVQPSSGECIVRVVLPMTGSVTAE